MKKQLNLLLIILVVATFPLLAFGPQPAPLYAISLLTGHTYDQAHNTGYMDWSGSVGYASFYHEDWANLPPEEGGAICLTGCTESVTTLNDAGVVSGNFDRDVTYFEAMLAYEYKGSGIGSAIITACSVSYVQYLGKNSTSAPGFNSFALDVPAGCRTWSVRATGGYVHMRSVDVEYVAAPPTSTYTPTPTFTFTPTFTPTFTQTFTPTATATGTQPPTATFTPTFTPSATATGTQPPTATFTSTFTPSATATATFTQTATPTGTLLPTFTFTPTSTATAIPTSTPVVQQSIVVLVPNIIINSGNSNTNSNTTSGGGSSSGSGFSAMTPAAMQGQGGVTIWGANVCGGYYIRVRVYVDDNQDKLMSPAEGITSLQLFLLDQTYARLGSAYTVDGHAAFCLPPAQYGKAVYIDIPYLQQFKSVQVPEQPDQDPEIWFPGEPPVLPLYLP